MRSSRKEDGKSFRGFSPEVEAAMLGHPWPGNVRQLQNVVRSIVVLHDGESVTHDMLPREMHMTAAAPPLASLVMSAPQSAEPMLAPQRLEPQSNEIKPLEDVIRSTIERAIELSDGSIPRAAAALRVSPSTLYRRIQGWQDAETQG